MSDTENCSICLAEVKVKGGGVPLFTPGCCGKWLHQKCIEEYVKTAVDTKCPSCRENFQAPSWMLANRTANLVPPVAPQTIVTLPPRPSSSWNPFRYFGVPTTVTTVRSNVSQTEDVLPVTTERISDNLNSNIERIQSSISITTTPEYSCVGISAVPSFCVRVSLNYNDTPITSEVQSESSLNTSKMAVSSKTALDVVCILDNSGSMQGTKMDSLKSAMRFVVSTLGPNDRYFN